MAHLSLSVDRDLDAPECHSQLVVTNWLCDELTGTRRRRNQVQTELRINAKSYDDKKN